MAAKIVSFNGFEGSETQFWRAVDDEFFQVEMNGNEYKRTSLGMKRRWAIVSEAVKEFKTIIGAITCLRGNIITTDEEREHYAARIYFSRPSSTRLEIVSLYRILKDVDIL